MSDQTRKAVADLGAEALTGSGFEDETPDPEFTQESASGYNPQPGS
jgi:hypothetical protein